MSDSADTSSNSHIRYHYTNDQDGKRRRRQGKILGLLGHSWFDKEGNRRVSDRGIYTVASAFLAAQHLQDRSGMVLDDLPAQLAACPDFDWTYESRDSHYNTLVAIQGLVNATSNSSDLSPYAVIGDFTSKVSQSLSILNNALDIVQVSGSATSAALDGRPHFARTIPNDAGQAKAAMAYFQSLGVTHLANVYKTDSYGIHFNLALQREAALVEIQLASIPYTIGMINETLQTLRQSQYHIVYATVVGFDDLFTEAYQQQMTGTAEYRWYLSEKFSLTSPSYYLERPDYETLGKARSGIGLVNVYFPPHEALHAALAALSTNATLQDEFISKMPDPELRQAFVNYTWPGYSPHSNQYLYYDAVIAVGLATCQQSTQLFSGSQLYQTLLQTSFEGTSGRVAFDPTTGTRDVDTVAYRIDNIVLNWTRSDDERFVYDSNLSAIVTGNTNVTHLGPFVSASINVHNESYYQYGVLPPQLPTLQPQLNLIPVAVQWMGYALALLVIGLSVGCMTWTYWNRKVFVIRASQPFFLMQLTVGTFVMASAVFPMSFQGGLADGEDEAQRALNLCCMLPLWLIFLGFVIAVSALLSKTWRLNQLMNSGRGLRRIQVQPRQVMLPFLVLMVWHVAWLVGLTLVAPYRFERVPVDNYDRFGRSVESYGTCAPPERKHGTVWIFLTPMLVADLIVVVIATYQSYKARNLPTEFSESSYLAISMCSMLETFLLGGPILVVVHESNPTALYLVGSLLLCICCLTILLPVFVPKYLQRNARCTGGRNQASLVAASVRGLGLPCSGPLHNNPPFNNNINNNNNLSITSSQVSNQSGTDEDAACVRGRMRVFRKSGNSSRGSDRSVQLAASLRRQLEAGVISRPFALPSANSNPSNCDPILENNPMDLGLPRVSTQNSDSKPVVCGINDYSA